MDSGWCNALDLTRLQAYLCVSSDHNHGSVMNGSSLWIATS